MQATTMTHEAQVALAKTCVVCSANILMADETARGEEEGAPAVVFVGPELQPDATTVLRFAHEACVHISKADLNAAWTRFASTRDLVGGVNPVIGLGLRDLVVDALHFGGGIYERDMLTPHEQADLYVLCDGFGDFRANRKALASINGGWDWSHVRDSSPAAIVRCAQRIALVLRTAGVMTRCAR